MFVLAIIFVAYLYTDIHIYTHEHAPMHMCTPMCICIQYIPCVGAHTNTAFTKENLVEAVKDLGDKWERLGTKLCVPQAEI